MTDQKDKKKQTKPPQWSIGTEVYCTVFLNKEPSLFYMCKAKVVENPGVNIYRVEILEIASHPVGGSQTSTQSKLIGVVISKKHRELDKNIPVWMSPKSWLTQKPEVTKKERKTFVRRKDRKLPNGTGRKLSKFKRVNRKRKKVPDGGHDSSNTMSDKKIPKPTS